MRRLAFTIIAALAVFPLFARDLPNVDALATKQADSAARDAILARGQGLIQAGAPLQIEDRFGVPTMVWASRPLAAAKPTANRKPTNASSIETSARGFLAQYALIYRLRSSEASDAPLLFTHDTGSGPLIAKFQQRVNGIEIFREEINVLMNRQHELIAIGGYISSVDTPPARSGEMSFRWDPRNAIVNAYQDLTVLPFDASQLTSAGSRGGYDFYDLPASAMQEEPARVKKVYFHLPEGLEPGYYVEIAVRDEVPSVDGELYTLDYYAYVISALDGRVLFRNNLKASDNTEAKGKRVRANAGGFTYRVWADANGVPYDTPAGNAVHPKVTAVPDGYQAPFVAPNDVQLPNYPFSQNDPWLAPGAIETVGNNVDAYVDLVTPDGYTTPSDFRAQITGVDQFLHAHTPDTAIATNEQQQGSIQQLFFNNNFLHDWYYDSGFNEAARNAQMSNFGRGGVQNDPIRAEAQDYSGRNNANMLTPADGVSPRMQMYVFDTGAPRFLETLSPAAIAGRQNVGTAQFGSQVFDVTAQLVQPATAAGCAAGDFAGTAGKFVLVNREGPCAIQAKLDNAMAAGAAGFILVNLSASPTQAVNVTGSLPTFTIPFLSVSWNGAAPIKTELAASNSVTARMYRETGPDRDGTIDNQIVFHEWGHYLSNRLIGDGAGLVSTQSRGMGEGWGDFNAMMLTVREDDVATLSNATWNGAYALATYTQSGGSNGGFNQGYYYGIRRVPYSTEMSINPLTYRHIANGQPITGAPLLYGADGSNNAQVHNTGEVWAQMLWECYASLLRDTQGSSPRLTFAEAQSRMKNYLVASLKMTPPVSPTFVEARDAVLAAAYATDLIDYTLFWQAFAKRGLGRGATASDRYTLDNTGIAESFDAFPELVFDHAEIDDTGVSCDIDGILDAGETGSITIYLRNTGTTALSGITGTLSTSTSGFSVANGGALTFPDVDPLGMTAATIAVTAGSIVGRTQADFTLQYTHPSLANIPRSQALSFATNQDVIPASTSTDTNEAPYSPWSKDFNAGLTGISKAPFVREGSSLNLYWHGPNVGSTSDERLVSPVFTVDGSGSPTIQFDHGWQFEFDGGGNYDGGIVEASVNGGGWFSIGGAAYTGTLITYAGNTNPLQGQAAFVGNSPGTIHTSITQAIAPGSTLQYRFRIGSDASFGAAGWNIDNISMSGVVETPFATMVADPGCSTSPTTTTTTLASSANPSPLGAVITFTATITPAPDFGVVHIYDGTALIGVLNVSSGQATYSTSSLEIGPHSISAMFRGIAGFDRSTSATIVQTILKASAAVALNSTPNPTTVGDSIVFTATVTGSNGTPVGSVTFLDGATELGSIALTSGVATYTTNALAAGAHSITARYEGNTTTTMATSGVTTQTIAPLTPTITPGGPTTFCDDSSVTLTSSAVSGNQWYLNGNPIGGATNSTYVATASGNYTVIVTENTVASAESAAVTVTVNPTPATPTVTPGGPTTFCDDSSVTLTSSSASGNQWYLDGNPIGGATSATYVVTESGNYTVVVTSLSCPSDPSAPVAVTVNPIPATPTIATGGPTTFCAGGSVTLTSSSASGNQWYLDGNPIGSATAQQYVASVAGNYTVVVTSLSCASDSSAPTTVTINPNPDATISAPTPVVSGSTSNAASVADAGVGASYNWSITNGTITSGTGTNSIQFTAGSVGVLTLSVTVTTGASCPDTDSVDINVVPPPPSIASVTPNSGSALGGTAVTIVGNDFRAGATVLFDASAATNVVVVDSSHITCNAPAHAVGAVSVTVTNSDTTTDTLASAYTYVAPNFDANGDSAIDPADVFYLVAYLFTGGPAPAGTAGMASGDANGDGVVSPADIFYAVNYLFGGGPNPFATSPRPSISTSSDVAFSGSLRLGQPVRRGERWFVPVIVAMDEGSPMPEAISLRVRLRGAASDAVVHRGAVASPVFETSRSDADSVSYLIAFGQAGAFANGARSGVIGEIELSAAGLAQLEFDPALTMLVAGTRKATVANDALRVGGATIRNLERTPTPQSPEPFAH